MDMNATKSGNTISVHEPVFAEVRFDLVERDGGTFARLNDEDLGNLWESLPHGASKTERGEIECYLCEVAESDE